MIPSKLISRMLRADVDEYVVPDNQFWRVYWGSLCLGVLAAIKLDSNGVAMLEFLDGKETPVHSDAELEVEIYTLSSVII